MADTRVKDLHLLPKFRDSLSFLYAEHVRVDRHENAIALHDADGMTPVPVASLAVLMLGPGSNITHSAVNALAENNCLVVWCGEENVRFYACGMGGTRSAQQLMHQAKMASDEQLRLQVVRRMYCMRFVEDIPEDLSVEQLRGMEGSRVRTAYAKASTESGVPWTGRSYDRANWGAGDPVNRALSAANSCLYGLCHAAILSAGYSPALGFIHTGKQLSFVYDIADLYKVDLTVPLAFTMAAQPPNDIERGVRLACPGHVPGDETCFQDHTRHTAGSRRARRRGWALVFDSDEALPADLWTPSTELDQKDGLSGE